MGHPGFAADPGRPGVVVASDKHTCRRRIRRNHVPGHANRPRRDHTDRADVAALRVVDEIVAGEDRADRDQYRATSAADAGSLSQARPLDRPRDRVLRADLRVVVVGTGGLSHQLDGTRAGFVNKEFDALCLDKIVAEPEALTRYSIHDWVEQSGSQGVEFLNWMAMRGALTGRVSELSRNYHIPISNTAAATVAYENETELRSKAA